jgi:hypothetical protein
MSKEKVVIFAGIEKYLKEVSGKRILKIAGTAEATGDLDRSIGDLRKSRVETIRSSARGKETK